jgi:hypothetical protein
MIQTGFAEQFYASHRMGPAPISLNFSKNNLKGDLSNDTTDNPPLFSLVNTFKADYGINESQSKGNGKSNDLREAF